MAAMLSLTNKYPELHNEHWVPWDKAMHDAQLESRQNTQLLVVESGYIPVGQLVTHLPLFINNPLLHIVHCWRLEQVRHVLLHIIHF